MIRRPCDFCGSEFDDVVGRRGRVRIYCSRSCGQRAYLKRQAEQIAHDAARLAIEESRR